MPKSILITRPEKGARDFWLRLDQALPGKFMPVFVPMTEIRALAVKIDFTDVGALIFTSANAVEEFAARWTERGFKAWCVGDATRDAALAAGLAAVSANGDGQDLVRTLKGQSHKVIGNYLHVRGVHSAGIDGLLAKSGLETKTAIIYDQVAKTCGPDASIRLHDGVDLATFFSPRSARLFAEMTKHHDWPLADTTAVCLSPAIADVARSIKFMRVVASAKPRMTDMLAELARIA